MNYKAISFFLGIYLLLVSFFSILNIFYSIYFDFAIGLNSYLITFFISLLLGATFYYIGHRYSKEISLIDQIISILLIFIFIPFLISIPYYYSIYDIKTCTQRNNRNCLHSFRWWVRVHRSRDSRNIWTN